VQNESKELNEDSGLNRHDNFEVPLSRNQANNSNDNSSENGRKRYRRTANEIERRFICWCGKAYGSEGSLN
jgi:hypothetical protein